MDTEYTEYNCIHCEFRTRQRREFMIHLESNRHIMSVKRHVTYTCLCCRYETNRKNDYVKHCKTDKHFHCKKNMTQQTTDKLVEETALMNYFRTDPTIQKMIADAIASRLVNSGNGIINNTLITGNDPNTMVNNIAETINNTTFNNAVTNNNFNLSIFLNEICKNAMNMSDFINSVIVNISDLEKIGKIGYVGGITDIFVRNLNSLDETIRPIHCSDLKREVFHIKDNGTWEKDIDKSRLTSAIKTVADKNIRKITDWVELHPDCKQYDSKANDQYLRIISNSMSGLTEQEQADNVQKIIHNIAKEVTIDKYCNMVS